MTVHTVVGEDSVVQPLAETIRRELSRWNLGAIEESIFGTADPEEMAAILDRYCSLHLGARPVGGLFYLGSAGCAVGIRLQSGDEIAIKAYQDRWSGPYLSAVQSVQTYLSGEGFPCPCPLAPPRPLQPGRPNLAMVESFLADPGMEPLHGSQACGYAAAGLARQVTLCRSVPPERAFVEHPLHVAPGRLYPEPHSPLFDFERPSAVPHWIDGYAARASVVREADHSTPVVAHMDWSARNIRIGPRGLVAGLRLGQPCPGAREHCRRPGRGDMVRHQRTRRLRVSFAREHHRVRASVRRGSRRTPRRGAVARHGRGRRVRVGLHRSL